MKILDATAVIAFLSEMKCPEAIIELSKRTKIIVPEGVAHEIVRPPGKETLLDLAKRGIVETLIFRMLELVKDVVMSISDLKTEMAKYRSAICIIWSVPKRKNKRKAKPSLLKIVSKWDHYWFLCRHSPILQPLLKC